MTPMMLAHQAVLFAHLIAAALTLSAVLREDLRWLLDRRIDTARLRGTMRTVSIGLAALWATGLALWAIAAAASPLAWAMTPKLAAKLVVVCLLTLNGLALHTWVFPRLAAGGPVGSLAWRISAALGAVSSASWVFAAFFGVARPIANALSLAGFLGLYATGLSLALVMALRLPRPVEARPRPAQPDPAGGTPHRASVPAVPRSCRASRDCGPIHAPGGRCDAVSPQLDRA